MFNFWSMLLGIVVLNLVATGFVIYRFRLLGEVKELRVERTRLQLVNKTLRESSDRFLRNLVAGIVTNLYQNISAIASASVYDEAQTMQECPACREFLPTGLVECPKCGTRLEHS